MDTQEAQQKMVYFIDKFVQDPFVKIQGTEENQEHWVISSLGNVVGEGNVLAKLIGPDDEEFSSSRPGIDDFHDNPSSYETEYVYYNGKTKEFISKLYGFARFRDKKFEIRPLVTYSDSKLKAYIHAYSSISKQLPTMAEIRKLYDLEKIIHAIEDFKINQQLEDLKNDPNKLGEPVLIAQGSAAVDGVVELLEMRKSIEKKVGTELEDGRIDYKEKDYFHTVTKGEVIAEKIPQVDPVDGVDVFGNTIKGKMSGESKYRVGENLAPEMEGSNIYVATIDGILDISKEDRKINIEERITVSGDVSLETGNIRFPGIVEIKGNVQPGFEVEATKDVFINGNVEDALVKTEGKVIVANGILGKEQCKVVGKEGVNARFIQNAEIYTEKDINVTESVVNASCIAKEYIKVVGHVVGGELFGRYGLVIGIAGSASESKTKLIAGKDPEVEQKIHELNEQINELLKELKENIDEMTQYFGDNILSEIKTVLPTLPEHRKKQCLNLLKKIKEINGRVAELKVERDKLKASLDFASPPTIQVNEAVFPGVKIQIKDTVKKIESKFDTKVIFREDPRLKVIFWD